MLDDVNGVQEYREKAKINIKKLIQTEKNYIDHLKSIQRVQRVFTFFDCKKDKCNSNKMEEPKSKFFQSNLYSETCGNSWKRLESDDTDVAIPPMPESLKEGTDRILFGNSLEILNYHEKYIIRFHSHVEPFFTFFLISLG